MIRPLKRWLAQGQRIAQGISALGGDIAFVVLMLSMNLWQWTTYPLYYVGVATAIVFLYAGLLITNKTLRNEIYLAIALNNLAEELGMRDPATFTMNEYVTAIVIVGLTTLTFFKKHIPSWKNWNNV